MSPLTCPHCHATFTLAAVAATSPAVAASPPPPPLAAATPVPLRPSAPEWFCPVHRVSKIVPAGTSKKTGKPYSAFWACTEFGCDQKGPYHAAAGSPPPVMKLTAEMPPPMDLEEM